MGLRGDETAPLQPHGNRAASFAYGDGHADNRTTSELDSLTDDQFNRFAGYRWQTNYKAP